MTEEKPPTIDFPCDYPIKVMGKAGTLLQCHVIEVMNTHDPHFDETTVTIMDSRNGNWQSVRVTITATGEVQLKAIFEDLKASSLVQMVL
jgi:putative lipoic acid-binding regulatory protein